MGATLREVACRVGVSLATASRALTRSELVEGSSRCRVIALAGDLAYTPNPAARALSTGRTVDAVLAEQPAQVPELATQLVFQQATGRAAEVGAR